MRMAPRATVLILVGIVIYVSLSLYHWRQVQKIPGKDKQKGVQSVLARDSHKKNWVQVTTAPGEPLSNGRKDAPSTPKKEPFQDKDRLSTPSPPLPSKTSLEEIKTPAKPSVSNLQTMPEEQIEQEVTLQEERALNKQKSEKINDLQAEVKTLQSALEETSKQLKEKERALDEQKKIVSSLQSKKEEIESTAHKIQSLKTLLASKIDALAKANERIMGLSDKLDQSRRTIDDLQSSNTHLQGALVQTETDKLDAQNKSKLLQNELFRVREDKETYLAEIGEMHTKQQQTKTLLARLENELSDMRLQSQAMLRYGQQQTELITPFRQEIEILNARVDDKKIELLKAEDQLYQLQDTNDALQKEVLTLQLEQQKNEHINNELKSISLELEKERNHSLKLSEQLKGLADQLKNRDEILASFQNNLAQAKDALLQSEQQVTALKEKNKQHQQQLEKSETAGNVLRQQVDQAKVDLEKIETELNKTLTEKDQLMAKVVNQKQLLEEAQAKSAQLALQIEESKKQLTAAVEQQKSPQNSISETEPLINNARDDKDEPTGADDTKEDLKLALHDAETRLQQTENELQHLKQLLAETEKKQTGSPETLTLQSELDELKNALAEKEQQQENMTKRIKDLENTNTHLQKESQKTEDAQQTITELESVIEVKERALQDKLKTIDRLQEETANLETQLDQRETDFFQMQGEFTSLQDTFDSLQKERDALLLHTLDTDNDGISDAQDKCQETIENTRVGEDGCELDSDQDGLVDRLDLCPASSEQTDINSLGCAKGEPIILSGLFFREGDAELSEPSRSYLDGVVELLKLNEGILLEVSGHTDSIGDIRWNKILSRKRAEAVTGYLSEKGIDSRRLFAVGYGPERPVADNESAAGRSANRRVELKVVSQNQKTPEDENRTVIETGEEEGLPAQ